MASILLIFFQFAYALPSWATTDSLNRNIYTVSCNGEGPSLDLARIGAKKNCLISATQRLLKNFKFKTLVIETEKDAALHQEISSSAKVSGLECLPEKEEIYSTESQFRVWILCKFDFSSARAENSEETPVASLIQTNQISSEFTSYNTSTIPICESIIFEGTNPRVQRCSSNPLRIAVSPGDRNIIIRAVGYKPTVIPAKIKNFPSVIVLEESGK